MQITIEEHEMSGQKNHQGRRRSPMSLALFAVILLIAGTASAASDTNRNYSSTLNNDCNGEQIVFNGTEHIVDNTKVQGDRLHINTMRQANGRGPGTMSGAEYIVANGIKSNMKVPVGNVFIRNWSKANAQSSGNPAYPAVDFWQLAIFHVRPDGTPGPTKFETRCHPNE
jgi:hypothetical protein